MKTMWLYLHSLLYQPLNSILLKPRKGQLYQLFLKVPNQETYITLLHFSDMVQEQLILTLLMSV
ncbi:hypothetical protein SDC9_132557 [bioreactor metagenome]|uniref:Uncharacterized protein n=1 Tax=bioreactor metagenome TaxID=1076179 RepID=A0A645D7Y5_9ZZZZ